MNDCYLTGTGSFLPGEAIDNDSIDSYLGKTLGEARIKKKILAINGIRTRHYALDRRQNSTHSVYELAAAAVQDCLWNTDGADTVDYLAAGTTYAPLLAPGLASVLHDELAQQGVLTQPVEITSQAGICTSGAQALVNASRAVRSGDARLAVCVGAEQPSVSLRAKSFKPPHDLRAIAKNVRTSKWFMATFLRFMLSDGAGAFVLEPEPRPFGSGRNGGLSLKVDWTYSRSFANQAPLCMQLRPQPLVLSQDVAVLAKHMGPLSKRVLTDALERHGEELGHYSMVLPHMSSYFFEPTVKKILKQLSPHRDVPYWTNLATAGNTGAASIYIMLDEYLANHRVTAGDRLLLFVPESGQFNYVLISLTVV